MPRVYKTALGSRPRKKFTQEAIDAAIEIAKNTNISIKQLSKQTGITYSVLYRRLTNTNTLKIGGQRLIPDDVEEAIVPYLKLAAEWGCPLKSIDLREMISDFLEKHYTRKNIGREYTFNFMKRHHNDLGQKCYDLFVSKATNEQYIDDYFVRLKELMCSTKPENVVTVDAMSMSEKFEIRVMKTNSRRIDKNDEPLCFTVLVSAAASDILLPHYFIYKAEHFSEDIAASGPEDARYSQNSTGWVDSKTFDDWIDSILIPYSELNLGKTVVIGNHRCAHFSLDAIKKCQEKNIEFIFLPTSLANLLKITLPLQEGLFQRVDDAWRNTPELQELEQISRDNLMSHVHKAFSALIKDSKDLGYLKEGFEMTGIYPFDPLKMNHMELLIMNTLNNDSKNKQTNVSCSITESLNDRLVLLKNEPDDEEEVCSTCNTAKESNLLCCVCFQNTKPVCKNCILLVPGGSSVEFTCMECFDDCSEKTSVVDDNDSDT